MATAVPLTTLTTVSGAANYAVRDIACSVGNEQVTGLFHQIPAALSSDAPTLQRLSNLIAPVNASGTRGSYAGWITRSAIASCAARADAANFASLLLFFQSGGSIRKLETIAARVLPPFPDFTEPASFMIGLISWIDPMGGWREHRRTLLSDSKDPLSSLKRKEVDDRAFRLTAGEASPSLGRAQAAAYLDDKDVSRLLGEMGKDGADLLDERKARRRFEKTKEKISVVLADPKTPYDRLWVPQIKNALRNLGDDHSLDIAARINKEYTLIPCAGDFERKVRKRHHLEGVTTFHDPATQRAVYFKESAKAGAEMYVQCHPRDLPWNLEPPDVLFEVLATVDHEDDHHVQLQKRKYAGTRREKFAFELHGHSREYLSRARHGDPGPLKSLTIENPLGFALAFRDYFEINY